MLFLGTGIRIALSCACGAVIANLVHRAPVWTHPSTSTRKAARPTFTVLTERASAARAAHIRLATVLALACFALLLTRLATEAVAIYLEFRFDMAAATLATGEHLSPLRVVGSHC